MAYEKTTRWADKVRGNFQAPENAPRLVDLIRLDNEDMRTVFYHYLRDTLVANDMDQASFEIAKEPKSQELGKTA